MAIGLIDRLRIDPSTGCWNWTGAKTRVGYGKIWYKKKCVAVHRLAAHLWRRFPLYDKRLVLHSCDNRLCFNPKHLFFGTYLDNVRDCIQKGRFRAGSRNLTKTHCPKGHPYSDGMYSYRKKNGVVCRNCRACGREFARAYRERLKR